MLFVYMSVDMYHFLSVFVDMKLVLTSVNLWMLHMCVSVTRCTCMGTCFLNVNRVSEHISSHMSAFVGPGCAWL